MTLSLSILKMNDQQKSFRPLVSSIIIINQFMFFVYHACRVYMQVTSLLTCKNFRLFSNEQLTRLYKFCVDRQNQTVQFLLRILVQTARFCDELFKICRVRNFVRVFWNRSAPFSRPILFSSLPITPPLPFMEPLPRILLLLPSLRPGPVAGCRPTS